MRQREFHDEIELDSEGAEDFLRKYRNCFFANTPVRHEGFVFLITSILLDNEKIMVNGLQIIEDA